VTSALGDPDDPTQVGSPQLAAGPGDATAAPRTLGHYRLLEAIGRGGMGVVYAALDTRLGRRVAVKLVSEGAGEELRARFRREARSMARLGKHPNLVQIHDVGEDGGRVYLVMDLVPGPTLAHLLREGPLAPARAAAIGEKVARALAHLHAHGLVHRDVKPSNVLLGADGEPQLSDLGLVLDAGDGERLSATGAILGTPSYMAPEQAESPGAVDARADVYGAGALLYHAVTGRPPFDGESWAMTVALVLEGSPPRPRALAREVGRDLEAVIERAIEREPGRRYPSAQALADDLGRAARGEAVQARPRPLWRRALVSSRRSPLRAALAMLALVLVAGLAAAFPGYLEAGRRAEAEALRAQAESVRAGAAALGTTEAKLEALGRAIALDPLSWRAFADRAQARVDAIEERERVNEKFAARYPSQETAQEALLDCDRALALEPEASRVLLSRAELKERLGDAAGAEEDHARFTALERDAASAYVGRGRRRWEFGDRAGAIALLDRAQRLAPDALEPYLFRGPMLAETGKFDAAIADYDRAIERDPRNAKLHYGRAHLRQYYKRDVKGALQGFTDALALDPSDANNFFARGNLRRMVRPPDLDGAIADYRRAIELSATINGPATNLGILLSQRGEQAEARVAFTEAIRRDPRFGMNYFGRAMTYLEGEARDAKAALADLDLACEREAKEPLPFWRRGALREEAGDLEGAIADYQVALARIPEGNRQRQGLEETIAEVRARLDAGPRVSPLPEEGGAPEAPTPSAAPGTEDF